MSSTDKCCRPTQSREWGGLVLLASLIFLKRNVVQSPRSWNWSDCLLKCLFFRFYYKLVHLSPQTQSALRLKIFSPRNILDFITPGTSNLRPKGHMWPSPALSVHPWLRNNHTLSFSWTEIKAWGRHSAVLTQQTANNVMDCDILSKHRPVNSKKYAAVLSIVIQAFENKSQDCQKKSSVFWYVCNSIFSWHKYIT